MPRPLFRRTLWTVLLALPLGLSGFTLTGCGGQEDGALPQTDVEPVSDPLAPSDAG